AFAAQAARDSLRAREKEADAGEPLWRALPSLLEDEAGREAAKRWRAVATATRGPQFGPAAERGALADILVAQFANLAPPRRGEPDEPRAIRADPSVWVAEHKERLGLDTPDATQAFASRLAFLGERWLEVARAAAQPGEHWSEFAFARGVGLNEAWAALTIAALDPDDPPGEDARKLAVAAAFIDVLAARCAWAPRGRDAAQLGAFLVRLTRAARGKAAGPLAQMLAGELDWVKAPFDSVTVQLGAPGHGPRTLRHLLARLTAHVEERFGGGSGGYGDYLRDGPTGFALEQVIAPARDLGREGYASLRAPEGVRAQLGGFVLLPTTLKSRLAIAPPKAKLSHYADAANLVARALSDAAGRDDAQVRRYIDAAKAPTVSEGHFSGDDVKARNAHYAALAAAVWDPARIGEAARL
ncbi:MAG: hypothetical protein MI723_12420, partial [Caulobacterales bacterium]|nr:hypothetical protein [Caulobacterales bacterium]